MKAPDAGVKLEIRKPVRLAGTAVDFEYTNLFMDSSEDGAGFALLVVFRHDGWPVYRGEMTLPSTFQVSTMRDDGEAVFEIVMVPHGSDNFFLKPTRRVEFKDEDGEMQESGANLTIGVVPKAASYEALDKALRVDTVTDWEKVAQVVRARFQGEDEGRRLFKLGALYSKLADADAALKAYGAAFDADPRLAEAAYNQACIRAKKGEKAEAIALLKKALRALEDQPKKAAKFQKLFKEDKDLDPLRGTPEFKALKVPN